MEDVIVIAGKKQPGRNSREEAAGEVAAGKSGGRDGDTAAGKEKAHENIVCGR
ncbi:MAG: hypothetical protein IJ106_01100 [Parasporobacterium sp.]|nr:hypothetical protein [Parasporobacterium sp.]